MIKRKVDKNRERNQDIQITNNIDNQKIYKQKKERKERKKESNIL